jgi:hypothetical protein
MRRLAPLLLSVLLLVNVSGCTKQPPDLDPDAVIAFHATRVVKVLNVLRDASIAANEMVPPALEVEETRKVVLWHKSAVQVIPSAPAGWQATVKATLFMLTCHPLAAPTQPPPPCTAQLAPSAVTHLYPYIGLAVVVINEVK